MPSPSQIATARRPAAATAVGWLAVVGALGLLVSPSRGLLVFLQFLGFSGLGMVKTWLDARYHSLRPLTIATVAVMALQCKWFDWWGGWTYGYRPWLDTVPLLVVFIVANRRIVEGVRTTGRNVRELAAHFRSA